MSMPRPPLVLLAASGAVALLALAPLAYLAVRAGERGWDTAMAVLWRGRTAELAIRSVALAAAVTAACVVVGVLAAWLVTRSDLPGRRMWTVLLALPLAVPSYVAGFTWIAEWPSLAGFSGAFIVLTAVSYPLVLLPVAASLRTADPATEEVSRSLGRGPVRTFLSVTLRRVWPSASAGGLLVALYVLSDFGAVSLMRYEAFTLGIYTSYRASFDRTPAAVLGCVLVVLAVLMAAGEAIARRRASSRVGSGTPRALTPASLGRWRVPALVAVALVVIVALGVPVLSLVRWLLAGRTSGIELGTLGSATLATVEVSALGALVTTALALPVGMLAARHRGTAVRGVELAAYAGHALPGLVVGLSLVFLGIRLVPDLYQRTPLLVVAYAVLFLPLAVAAVRSAVATAPPVFEEMSRSLGRGRLATFGTVTLPLAAPGVLAGAVLVFLTCAKELPATLLLAPTGTATLATELWTRTSVAAYAEAAPFAALLVVVAAVPAMVLDRVMRR
jgi:iron(III) transport system permease protein